MRSNGLGDWGNALEDALTGQASQYLLADAREEQVELTKLSKEGEWQYAAVKALKETLDYLDIEAEELPVKSDMKRWFRLFATLRNKTRAHGATLPAKTTTASPCLALSINIVYQNFCLFRRSWVYLHRNISGKYRVSPIAGNSDLFESFKKVNDRTLADGVYVFVGAPRRVALVQSDPDLQDFFFVNGGLGGKTFELLSYYTDDKINGDASAYLIPPGTLPASETQGLGDLIPKDNCFTNVPDLIPDYVNRSKLEDNLHRLLQDDKRPIVTLVGRGGIGKTSLALKVIPELYDGLRYKVIVWLSAET